MNSHFVDQEELQAWLDGELTPERASEVKGHIGDCSECSAVVEELKIVTAALQSWEVESAPATLQTPSLPAEKSGGWLMGHKFLAFAATVGVILIIAAISIPNLLRSRMSVSPRVAVLPMSALENSRNVAPNGGSVTGFAGPRSEAAAQASRNKSGRMIAWTATISVEVDDIAGVRQRVQAIVAGVNGFMGRLSLSSPVGQRRNGSFTLMVPTNSLDRVLAELRELGKVTHEQTDAEEITDQFTDLEARLRNARATERRLITILNQRAAKLSHILEVEREIARKRGEIERMEAQRENMLKRARLATVRLNVWERFADPAIETPSGVLAQMWHTLSEGVLSFLWLLNALVLFFLRWGLHLALFGLVGWQVWRRWLGPALRERESYRL